MPTINTIITIKNHQRLWLLQDWRPKTELKSSSHKLKTMVSNFCMCMTNDEWCGISVFSFQFSSCDPFQKMIYLILIQLVITIFLSLFEIINAQMVNNSSKVHRIRNGSFWMVFFFTFMAFDTKWSNNVRFNMIRSETITIFFFINSVPKFHKYE